MKTLLFALLIFAAGCRDYDYEPRTKTKLSKVTWKVTVFAADGKMVRETVFDGIAYEGDYVIGYQGSEKTCIKGGLVIVDKTIEAEAE